jgi:hypothetical protein
MLLRYGPALGIFGAVMTGVVLFVMFAQMVR